MSIQFACLSLGTYQKQAFLILRRRSFPVQQRVKQLVAVQEDVSFAAVKVENTGRTM
jgi:hypothetical protein